MQVFTSFLRGIGYGMVCGILAAVCLLALVFFTVGLNDSNGIVNAYTLFLCVIFGIVGAIIGGIVGIVAGFTHSSRTKKQRENEAQKDDAPIAKP